MTTRHDEQTPQPVPAPAVGTVESAARRRALLKGLSKGAALAGSAVPLSSLATGERKKLYKKSDGKNYHCSVSGHMSVMMSAGVTVPPSCQAKRWDYYKTPSNWPYVKSSNGKRACYFGNVLRDRDEKFKDCFGWGTPKNVNGTDKTLWDCINTNSPDEYTDWVCSVLNANFATHNYPYTSADVVDHSKGLGGVTKANAYAFHKNFSRDSW
jgi:hypothetical protein